MPATALYENGEDDMLQFAVGDVIEVLQLDDATHDGYWLGRANGQV